VTQRDANGERIVDRNTFLPPDDTDSRIAKIERGYTVPQQTILDRLAAQEVTNADVADQIVTIANTTVNTSVTTGGGVAFIPSGQWMAPGGYASNNPVSYSTVSIMDSAFYVIPFMCAAGTYNEWAFIVHNDVTSSMRGCYSLGIYDAAGGKAGDFKFEFDGPGGSTPRTGGTVVTGTGSATLAADGTYWFLFASTGNSQWVSQFSTRGINSPYAVLPLVASNTATASLELWPQPGLAGFSVYPSNVLPISLPASLPAMGAYYPFGSVVPRVYLRRV
jgi:hypothetical protein